MNIRQLNHEEYDKAVALSLDVFTKCGTTAFLASLFMPQKIKNSETLY